MSHHDDLPTIETATLDEVTGGVTSTGSNAQLTTALQGITSSVAGLGANNSNGGSSLQSLLPMMLMLGRGGGAGGGGACPCGCGMANCGRR
jgi:hypothetical protein